jgi:hypothetical protein
MRRRLRTSALGHDKNRFQYLCTEAPERGESLRMSRTVAKHQSRSARRILPLLQGLCPNAIRCVEPG